MARKAIEQASAAEIRKFAAERCGLDIHANANKQTAAQRLRTAWAEDWIEVTEDARVGDMEAERQAAIPEELSQEEAWYRLTIAPAGDNDMDQLVQVGVNGSVMVIPRGEEVEVRGPYVEVLRRAIQQQYSHVDPQDMNSEIIMREVPLYPIQQLQGPFRKTETGELIAA